MRLGATLGYLSASCGFEWEGDSDCNGDNRAADRDGNSYGDCNRGSADRNCDGHRHRYPSATDRNGHRDRDSH